MSNDYAGRVAVVVGGSSGMGRAVVNALVEAGATVISTSRQPETSSATTELRAAGVKVVAADITSAGGLTELLAVADRVDYLVLSAASLQYKPFREFSAEEASATVTGKLLGYWNVIHQLAPRLSKDASVVLFSGVAAARPGPGTAAVTVANAGIEGLARSLAVELAPVRTNALNPGIFDTESYSEMSDDERSEFLAKTAASLPVGRVGDPDDAAHAVLFLLGNPHVTGTVLDLDGGTRLA